MKKFHVGSSVLAGFIALSFLLHAQETETPAFQVEPLSLSGADMPMLKSLSEAQLAAFVSTLDATPTIPVDALPKSGTYWSLANPAWPPLPGNFHSFSVWEMDGGHSYLLNDIDFDYNAEIQSVAARGGMQMMSFSGPPGFGDIDTNGYGTNIFFSSSLTAIDYGTNLWIAQVGVTNGYLAGIGSNTLADVQYEIQSRTNLLQSNWLSEGFIRGSETNNWTPLSVVQGSRTNLFIRLRSTIDSANVGIPDWWQLQYFGYVGINPYAASPSGDGFSIWHKYQNGLNPTNFETPPAPNNFVAVLSTNGTNVLLSWNAAQGSVTNYSIVRGIYNYSDGDYDYSTIAMVNASTNSFLDAGVIHSGDDPYDFNYRLTANYQGGHTSGTAYSGIYDTTPPPTETSAALAYNLYASATLIRNETGRWQLMLSGLSAGVTTLKLHWYRYYFSYYATGDYDWEIDIPVSTVTNGIYVIPDFQTTNQIGQIDNSLYTADSYGFAAYVQPVDANNDAGDMVLAGYMPLDAPCFVDGREHLKQNLLFSLRAATIRRQYNGSSETNYAESSIFHPATQYEAVTGNWVGFTAMDNLWPFTVNYQLHPSLFDPGHTNVPNSFVWQTNLVTVPAPAVLGIGDPYWVLQYNYLFNLGPVIDPATGLPIGTYSLNISTSALADLAAYTNTYNLYLQNGIHNLFGLAFETALVNPNQYSFATLDPGSSIGTSNVNSFFSQTADPNLQITNYYFAPVTTPGTLWPYGAPINQTHPLPALSGFAVTNQTRMMFAAVGSPIVIGGWAKYSIQNGNPNKFAYLGQYFTTNAWLLNTNGVATTNSAGIFSPYGEFFPTQAGQAQMTTMPDIDTGKQGTNLVQIISLNVDANHDGTMDLSYFGQDQTSPTKPYVFWCNNNYDRGHVVDFTGFSSDFEQDDLESDNCPRTPFTPTSDGDFLDVGGNRVIPCTRDLEDFSRLWISGVTTNLLAALPSGSTVTLSWGDVGSPNSANPTIDLFAAADTDGGVGYLTNSTIAANQINPTYSRYIERIGPGQSIQLNSYSFGSTWRGNHFIWCGVTNGSGKLTLSFKDGNGNVLGQASIYIQIQDIKQMYERWTVGDIPNIAPTDTAYIAQNDLIGNTTPFQYGPATTNTPYILFVHGWNMTLWSKDRFAETAFKRLYWQGYQGRFGLFRWPTLFAFPLGEMSSQAINPDNFDTTEYASWQSGAPLRKLLVQLNNNYPGQVRMFAHSHGNIAAGEALRTNVTLVHTYVAMQAAVPSHAYDPTTTNRFLGIWDSSTPERTAQYWTNGAACYFNNIAGAAHFANFYNFNDWALGWWMTDQNTKPDAGYEWIWQGTNVPEKYTYSNLPFQSYNLYFPTNTYEIFSYITEGHCFALGQQVDVSGVFDKTLQVNLFQPPHSFGSAHKGHSAEFRSDNASRSLFWKEVLKKMDLKP